MGAISLRSGRKGEAGFRRGGLLAILSLLSAGAIACQAAPSLVKPRLEGNGQVFLYLQPLGQEAERLAFRLEGVSAMRGDGGAVPIALHAGEIRGRDPKGDRLLASGILPPGQYTGFTFRAKSATLRGEEGEAALSVGGEDPLTPIPFTILREGARVVSLKLRYRESLPGGGRFSPSFSAEIPGKPSAGVIGAVTSRSGNTVTLFDKMTGRVVGVVPTGVAPVGMAIDRASMRAYVAASGDDSLEMIDLLGGSVLLREQLSIGDRPEEILLTPDRRYLLTANTGSDTVSLIDAATLTEIRRIPVGNGPQAILPDRAGRRVYVFNTLSGTISVLDLGTLSVTATIGTDPAPMRGDFNRAGNRLYVLHANSSHLGVYDPATLALLRRVHVGIGGAMLKVDPRSDLIYLARRGTGEVAVYDPSSFLPFDILRTGEDVSHLAIDGETNNLFLVLPAGGEVRAVLLAGKTPVFRIDVADLPVWVTLVGER